MSKKKIKWFDVEQNKEDWYTLRIGKLTASSLSIVMANYGKPFSGPAKRLAVKIAFERLNNYSMSDHYGDAYSNAEMERGHIQEPIARALYEYSTFSNVTNGGFFCNDFLGFSPDGLVDDDGVIEIKSVKPPAHHENKIRNTYDPSYRWQIIGNLWASGREWLDFVSYCSFAPKNNQLIVYRINACDLSSEFNQLINRTNQFKKLVNEIMREY